MPRLSRPRRRPTITRAAYQRLLAALPVQVAATVAYVLSEWVPTRTDLWRERGERRLRERWRADPATVEAALAAFRAERGRVK